MWYAMGYERDVAGWIAAYAGQGRKIWAQELDLSPAQRIALRSFLVTNYQPANREYFYDYYRDNCSTRIRDAIDRVLGGAIYRYGQQPSSMTWRDETRRLNENRGPLYTGLLLALGQPVDTTMTRWEQMFLPGRLREHLDSVRVTGPDGSLRPLVKSERVLHQGGRWPAPDRPTSWILRYAIAGLLVGGLLAGLGRTWAFLPLATLWALLAGLGGALLTYLAGFSHHVAAHRNRAAAAQPVLLALAIGCPPRCGCALGAAAGAPAPLLLTILEWLPCCSSCCPGFRSTISK
jgi:hypothetical protein